MIQFSSLPVPRFVGIVGVLSAIVLGCGAPPPNPPRTIFLVTIDTLRVDHLHFMGYPRPVSPFLDRLAEEGVVFENAVSSSSTTITSHASLFTSLHPAHHQMVRNGVEIHEGLVTMAEMFRGAGWQTAAVTTTGFLKGLKDGFEHFDARGRYFAAPELLGSITDWLANERDPERPAFVWIHLFDVHEWGREDRTPQDLYVEVLEIEPTRQDLTDFLIEEHGVEVDAWGRGAGHFLTSIQRYDTKILYVNRQLEQFQARMGELGYLDDSLWVITADHGEGFGVHGVLGHGEAIYQEQLRIPLIVWSPDGRYRGRVDQQVSHLDLLPTLTRVADVEIPEILRPETGIRIQGRDLVPVLEDPDHALEGQGWLYAQRRVADENRLSKGWAPGEMYTVYDGWWKYIHHEGGEGRLYDLESDPRETTNVAEDHPDVRDRLRRRAERWFTQMNTEAEEYQRGEISPEYIQELKSLGYL